VPRTKLPSPQTLGEEMNPTSNAAHHDTHPLFGRRIAQFNKRVTNRLTLPLAPWLPGFGVVIHIGRKSQREYRIPVNVFKTGDGYVFALTYGTDSDWVQNVRAAGGCTLITRGQHYRLTAPRIIHDETRQLASPLARPILRLMHVADFLRLDVAA
jgi:deazaflavin-dependent oxidoreductase (nitroreductase family)